MKHYLSAFWHFLLSLVQPLSKQVMCSIRALLVKLAILIVQELNKVIDEDLSKIIVELSNINVNSPLK